MVFARHFFIFFDIDFFYAGFRIVDQGQEPRIMMFVRRAHLTLRMRAPAPASFDSIFSYPRSMWYTRSITVSPSAASAASTRDALARRSLAITCAPDSRVD